MEGGGKGGGGLWLWVNGEERGCCGTIQGDRCLLQGGCWEWNEGGNEV